jgi:hypothetical protein
MSYNLKAKEPIMKRIIIIIALLSISSQCQAIDLNAVKERAIRYATKYAERQIQSECAKLKVSAQPAIEAQSNLNNFDLSINANSVGTALASFAIISTAINVGDYDSFYINSSSDRLEFGVNFKF